MSATIPPVARPRGTLSDEQLRELDFAQHAMTVTRENFQRLVVRLLADGCSFSEVSKATGLSTNTLQRWKREAGR